MSAKPILNFLRLKRYPIFEQLTLEEALFRVDNRNWFLWNEGTPEPTIVLGISGKPHKLVYPDLVQEAQIPLIKRFSGGGTVIVDHNTIFTTLICNKDSLPHVKPLPREIMEWSESVFKPALDPLMSDDEKLFGVRENDYAFGDTKIGGNAQSISKSRWLHHTSFLWDFKRKNMDFLQLPEKRPDYRVDRDHNDFLCTLASVAESQEQVYASIYTELEKQFDIRHVNLQDILPILDQNHRKSTRFISLDNC